MTTTPRLFPLGLMAAVAACASEPPAVHIESPVHQTTVALRPDQAGNTEQFRFGSSDVVEAHGSPSGDFLVHFTRAGINAVPALDADTDGTPDFVELVASTYDDVLAFYQTELGFDPPLSDAAVANNGGDARFDVYLVDFALSADGAFRLDACVSADQCLGFMVQENDFSGYGYPSHAVAIRTLASHEFFHAVQSAYDEEQGSVAKEGSAVWATEQYDPTLRDLEGFADGYFDNVDRSLDKPLPGPVDPFSYGTGVVFQFLSERYGQDVVRKLWEACRDTPGADGDARLLAQLSAVLQAEEGVSFADAMTELARWSLHTGRNANPAVAFAHGSELPVVKTTVANAPFVDEALRVFYASFQVFVVQKEGASSMTAALVGDAATLDGLRLVVGTVGTSGYAQLENVVPGSQSVPVLSMGGASSLVVVVVNTNLEGDSKKPGLCAGAPADVANCVAALTAVPPPPTDEPKGDSGGCAAVAPPAELGVALVLLGCLCRRRKGRYVGDRLGRKRRA